MLLWLKHDCNNVIITVNMQCGNNSHFMMFIHRVQPSAGSSQRRYILFYTSETSSGVQSFMKAVQISLLFFSNVIFSADCPLYSTSFQMGCGSDQAAQHDGPI